MLPNGITPYFADEESGIYIINADCRDILPTLEGVDLVLTDYPYGNGTEYRDYNDTEDALRQLIADTHPYLMALSPVVFITCGVKNQWLYPRPDWVLAWYSPRNTARSSWGFSCWQPCLAYGRDPFLSRGMGCRPDSTWDGNLLCDSKGLAATKRFTGHPCPKPESIWNWFLLRGSTAVGDTILDPMMGSGTTLVCAKKAGRSAIGIELSEHDCAIARERIMATPRSLFSEPARAAPVGDLFR